MKLSLRAKLIGGFGISVTALLVISFILVVNLDRLGKLQDEGAKRAHDAVIVQEAVGMADKDMIFLWFPCKFMKKGCSQFTESCSRVKNQNGFSTLSFASL